MKYYVVDAFADQVFSGNPAGVCTLEAPLSKELMQNIAAENNLSETAYVIKRETGKYDLKWFTPGGEIDLCGHATLATAYIVSRFVDPGVTHMEFSTLSGILVVEKVGEAFEMDFPVFEMKEVAVTSEMADVIGFQPTEAWMGRDLVCVLGDEREVVAATPNMEKLLQLPGLLLHLTAKGSKYDCVTRSFAPKVGVTEDPVCGSGHCHVAPLWAGKLGQDELVARQASARGGLLYCKMQGERISLRGTAVLYLQGEIFV